jgi:hypothetical protein
MRIGMIIRKNPGATAWFPVRRDKQLNCRRSLSDLKQDRFLTLEIVQRGIQSHGLHGEKQATCSESRDFLQVIKRSKPTLGEAYHNRYATTQMERGASR